MSCNQTSLFTQVCLLPHWFIFCQMGMACSCVFKNSLLNSVQPSWISWLLRTSSKGTLLNSLWSRLKSKVAVLLMPLFTFCASLKGKISYSESLFPYLPFWTFLYLSALYFQNDKMEKIHCPDLFLNNFIDETESWNTFCTMLLQAWIFPNLSGKILLQSTEMWLLPLLLSFCVCCNLYLSSDNKQSTEGKRPWWAWHLLLLLASFIFDLQVCY